MPDNNCISPLFTEAVSTCIQNNLTFAAYRLPNQDQPFLIIQKDSSLRTITQQDDFDTLKGFVVAPFSEESCCQTFLIEPDFFFGQEITEKLLRQLQSLKKEKKSEKKCLVPEEISKEEYLVLVRKIVDQIHEGIFEKVVPSRVKIVNGNYVSKLGLIFELLCTSYPNAFAYVFNSTGLCWMGATPEPLLLVKNGTMQTVSLAGTRPFSPQNQNIGAWNSKERLEQEYVTRYISKVVSSFNLIDVDQLGPYTKKAGNLLHLRTDFSFPSADLTGRLGEFLKRLHPTPAICGMPCKSSLELLMKLEKHNREYYAGYLGPVGINDNLSIFVNLRCMKVLHDRLALFVGGGITADSVPEDEWQETEIKADTLLSVLKQLRV
jgi:isochorismate synthase